MIFRYWSLIHFTTIFEIKILEENSLTPKKFHSWSSKKFFSSLRLKFNIFIQIRFEYVDVEYDAFCGLDKVHIFKGFIPKGGFRPHTVPKDAESQKLKIIL